MMIEDELRRYHKVFLRLRILSFEGQAQLDAIGASFHLCLHH